MLCPANNSITSVKNPPLSACIMLLVSPYNK
jgi:hypothetical protein